AYEARTRGEVPGWSPLAVQYADYALWQREVLGSDADAESLISRQIAYWSTQLAGVPDQLDLPSDRPRPAVASGRGATVGFEVPAELHASLLAVARAHDATLFMVVHAALAVLLARLSGTEDIAVGTPIAGRGERELDDLIGMFVNTLVLRTGVDGGESFTDLLAGVRETDLGAFGHADVPFERLVEILDPVRSQARNPLFQVALSFQNLGTTRFELPGLTVSGLDAGSETAKFDLQVTLSDLGASGGMTGALTYATDLFDEQTMLDFGARLVRVLEAVAADPAVFVGDIGILAADEARHSVVAGPEASGHVLLPNVLSSRSAFDPHAVAVRFEGRSYTYRELDDQSNRLARWLIAHGAGPETRVALAFPRSYAMVLGEVAVAKSGAAFVPVDPSYPTERVEYMLEDSAALLGITGSEFVCDLPADGFEWLVLDAPDTDQALAEYSADAVTDADRHAAVRVSNTAYMIYTSGSTGRPKGVAVTHSGFGGLLDSAQQRYNVSSDDRFMHICSPSFDPSVLEWMMAFSSGAALVVVPSRILGGAELADFMAEERVTHTIITPAVLASMGAPELADLEAVSVGGDVSTPELVAHWANGRRYLNGYGPTETTIISTYAELRADKPITVGGPVAGASALVLDARLHSVPLGVAGELYLSGDALARGYHARAGLTAERFVADPYNGGRMYRTGDLVRWTRSGELEFVGRSDFQVKIRGFRVELGEIDAALAGDVTVSAAATLGHNDATRGMSLVSYVVAAPGAHVDVAALTAAVAEALPSYMVPAQIMVLDAFPLTPIGKLDRKALPEPVFEAAVFRAPTTPIEQAVAGVFAEVLGIAQVGLDDDFFALGGNSLLAMQVTSRLGQVLDATIAVRVLFEASSVERLALAVESHAGAGRVALEARPRPERVPLSLAQQRMWFLNRFNPESVVDNIPVAIRLSGDLNVEALQSAVADVVARHESLRTIYPEIDGVGYQLVLPAAEVGLDLAPVPVTEAELFGAVAGVVGRGFDVTTEVPVRAGLFRVSHSATTDVEDVTKATEFVLVFVAYHIATDGFSAAPLARDVMVAYEARTRGDVPGWAALPVQYADFALWQREVLGSEDDPETLIAGQIDYWSTQLAGVPDQLDLPLDRPRPAVQSFAGAALDFEIDADLHAGLVELARAHDATLFMVVHAALAVLLARLSGTEDIAIGTPIAGRGERELDDLIGMFVNTLVLRTGVDGGGSFAELLAQTRETDLGAFGHADVPFERLVEILDPVRSQARNPLFQVALSFQN
ncbi:non-ribosomal peptide synthetase, partial [Aldersonia kunmingensis]|uniref:non-ribosomal peptide synthetase n=1 Tax=Aldersonia kunmingensis TaxID=408066 RepID=UPI000AD21EDE